MLLCHEQPAVVLEGIIGRSIPADALILAHGDPSRVIACRTEANPLAPEGWGFDPDLPGSRLLGWSGSLAEEPFASEPRNWMAAGREALDAFCARVRPALERHGWTLCLEPHARHVLSDATGCRDFLARHEGGPFEIALAPASLLESSMLEAIEEHLERQFAALGPLASLVILEDVAAPAATPDVDGDDAGAPLPRRVPLGEGLLPRDLVRRLLREHVAPGTPVVVRAEVGSARAWLEGV